MNVVSEPGGWGVMAYQILADQLALSQPWGPTHDYLPPRIFGPSKGPEMNVVVMAIDVARLRVPKASET